MHVFIEDCTKKEWEEKKRAKTLELIMRNEYGVRPRECDEPLVYRVVEEVTVRAVRIKKIEMRWRDYPMYFYEYKPESFSGKLPAFVLNAHSYTESTCGGWCDGALTDRRICAELVCSRGYALYVLSNDSVAKDETPRDNGIFAAMGLPETDESWGILSAWAWGCSKIMDYIVSDESVDAERVAVIGLSRGGKTALIAGATDERFFLTVSTCSGNSGAALSRGNTGEDVDFITKTFPMWFCKKYRTYAKNENALPFDQHAMLGLIAPRYLYVSSATDDNWADPKGELACCRFASQYYRLYGKKGVVASGKPIPDEPYHDGTIAYHIRTGDHGTYVSDWEKYLDYFDKIK